MKVEVIKYSGLYPALKAVHLPFSKPCVSTEHEIYAKDYALLEKLVRAGDEHAKVLRGVVIWLEITAPIYWWREMETYRVGRERLACESTMHVDCKGLSGEELQKAKADIPMGKEQTAVDMFSYQCLRRIYKQRKHHRLPEWREFCSIIERLPDAKKLIMCDAE